jgi:hypothetical protein
MLHAIITASTDDARVSVHYALREIDDDGVEHTVAVSGYVLPLMEVGLFGNEVATLLNAVRDTIDSIKRGIVDTPQ